MKQGSGPDCASKKSSRKAAIADSQMQIVNFLSFASSLQGKLEENKYKSIAQFESDVILVFDNAMRYNRPDSEIYATADKLKKVAERKLQKVKESHMGAAGSAPGAQDQGAESTRADRLKLSQLVNQLTPERESKQAATPPIRIVAIAV